MANQDVMDSLKNNEKDYLKNLKIPLTLPESICADKRPPTTRIFVSNTETFTFMSTFTSFKIISTARINSVSLPIIANVSSESIKVKLLIPQLFTP